MADTVRHFLPWVRQGAAAGITTPDSLGSNQPADVSLQVTLQFVNFNVPGKDMKLYGPADVTAIDTRQIVRVQPRPLTTNFESNFFPLIEFDRPDFPWLFTPAKAGLNERLRPWLCLVVVRRQEGVTLGRLESSPLSILEIRNPARVSAELPDLDESWAWVHAQVVGSNTETLATLKQAVETAPARTVARLMCPRRLDPDVNYVACLVPAFEVGRKAGLGLPVTDDERKTLAPSWSALTTEVLLPVYHSWSFTTGPQGDFESLVRDLTPRPLPDSVGKRPLDVSEPGFGLPRSTDGVLPMKGVLKPPEPSPAPPPSPVPANLVQKLAELLNVPAEALAGSPASDPIVAPPIYGSTYPPRDRVVAANNPAHWVNELNLDPRDRVAASMGTRIVQEDQEHLMASAWQQVDAINKANQDRRRLHLAQASRASTYERHVARLGADRLLQVTGTSLAKVAVALPEGQRTLAFQVSGSVAPGFETAVLRRLARPRGAINRRALTPPILQTQTQARPMVKLLDALPDVPRLVIPPPVRLPVGSIVTIVKVSGAAGTPQVDAARLVPASIPTTPIPRGQRPQNFVVRETQGQSQRSIDNNFPAPEPRLVAEFRIAAAAHLAKVTRARATKIVVPRVPDAGLLRNRLNPTSTPGIGILTRAAGPAVSEEEILAHPQFPAPMSERLIEHAPDFLLPGLQNVPANTVTLVQPNTRFIEAFMIGLNHEMGRELLWREYPTDRRGSYFRFFWNRRGSSQQQQPMTPIPLWNQPLGKNPSGAGSPDQLVLLVRGELFRRYPTAVIYAAKATGTVTAPKLTATEIFPLFRGSALPDVTFFGFDLTETAARGTDTDPGWFFVIQQQPGEPDFGLDLPADINPQPAPVTDWDKLTWRHLVSSAAEMSALGHVKVKPGTPPLPDTSANPPGAVWGHNGAHMARITIQKPVRIAILARQMLPPK